MQLATHDANGVTMKDVKLAETFDNLYNIMKQNDFKVSGLIDLSYSEKL